MRVTQSIIFILNNIKRHLTGRKKIITLSALIITLLFSGVLSFGFVSAMTYQDEVNVQFTFEPSLSISLSSPNLIISNLIPGNYSNSNTITVDVTTNNIAGYTLTAKVGGTGQTAANNSLVNTLSNTAFTSLGDSDNIILPNFSDNKWGFSTAASITDATTFSGLLYNEDKVINATTNYDGTAATGYTGTSSTNFTIGAKASADQAAGDYTNVITFTAVTNAVPDSTPPSDCSVSVPNITYMQEINNSNKSAVLASMIQDAQYHLLDSRDGKSYCVAKLADGNIWMTQNLDHDIVTTENYYTNENTDIGWNSTTNSYDSTTWTADYATSDETYDWYNAYHSISSFDPGDYYWTGEINDYGEDIATSETGDRHYHFGNYYSAAAAMALNSVWYEDWDPINEEWVTNEFSESGIDINRSICPAGWTLPKYEGTGSFQYLLDQYGYDSNTRELDNYIIYENPFYFTLGSDAQDRHWSNSEMFYSIGSYGYYWTSVTWGMGDGYSVIIALGINTTFIDTFNPVANSSGMSMRCVAR